MWQIFVIIGIGVFSTSYLYSCLNIREQVSHSYQTAGKIKVVNNLTSLPSECKQENKKIKKNNGPSGSMQCLNLIYS
jgi:hypothetical protein